MKVIYNNIIPFPGYKAMNLFGVLFVRKGCTMSEKDINHEAIHTAQMKEMLFIPFYLWYVIEWLVWLVKFRNSHLAYRRISFEREAYCHQYNPHYLKKRKHWAWWNFLTMKRKS